MSNMYSKAIRTWNPFFGCGFDCTYCRPSFQAQAKRQKHRCMKCYEYTPHEHPERLSQRMPKTKPGEFVFVCSMGDISFATWRYRERIIAAMRTHLYTTFLVQSKDPSCFLQHIWSANIILGTTIETNRGACSVSNAMPIWRRVSLFTATGHHRKMITIEPIMDFDPDQLAQIVESINPEMIWVGYDSRKCGLPEPPLAQVREFIAELRAKGHTVHEKLMREARTATCKAGGER